MLRIITRSSSERADGEKDPMKFKGTVWDRLCRYCRYYASFGLDLKRDWFARATLWMTLITGVVLVIVLIVL